MPGPLPDTKIYIMTASPAFLCLLLLCSPLKANSLPAFGQLPAGGSVELPEVPMPAGHDSVFPEDGSRPMKAWYTSFRNGHPSMALRSALAAEGVEPRDIGFPYDWIQDISLFDSKGGLILQADMPAEILRELNLTMGVLNTEDGYPSLTALSEAEAVELKLPYRRMEWTFLEGGALITGALADGSPYAITTASPVEGARLLYERLKGVKISAQQAKDLVAGDLRVAPENLFIVNSSGHLDLVITPLPGGVIILSDPSGTAGALRELLAAKPPAAETRRLEKMLELYLYGWQPLYAQSSAPMGQRQYPYDSFELKILDDMEKILGGRLKVIRAPGVFKDLSAYANSKDSFYIADSINFFNGFTGSGSSGGVFQVTNGARGLPSLENYWRGLLAGRGAARTYFPGSYGSGAGLDCAGAPAGR